MIIRGQGKSDAIWTLFDVHRKQGIPYAYTHAGYVDKRCCLITENLRFVFVNVFLAKPPMHVHGHPARHITTSSSGFGQVYMSRLNQSTCTAWRSLVSFAMAEFPLAFLICASTILIAASLLSFIDLSNESLAPHLSIASLARELR